MILGCIDIKVSRVTLFSRMGMGEVVLCRTRMKLAEDAEVTSMR